MKISIALASYNGAKYLQEQLQSFANQTCLPDELIITDDCSVDETETIAREFGKTVPFKVEFHRNKRNLGYCGNFNEALLKVTGDIVFLSDQDDVWFPEKIEHMVRVAERHPDALVLMNDALLTDGSLNEVGLTKLGQIRSAGLLMESFVMGCCCCIRRDLLDICLPIPVGFKAHDYWLVEIAASLENKIVEEMVLQYYRRHSSNESQFIANRIKKVTRTQAFFHAIKNINQIDAEANVRERIEQSRIFAAGIRLVSGKSPHRYRERLAVLEKGALEKADTAECRIEIRSKWLVPRVFGMLMMLASGGYKNTLGLSSILRDLAGK
jgi:glycosyltransferase involved in cell wall biosynthesis